MKVVGVIREALEYVNEVFPATGKHFNAFFINPDGEMCLATAMNGKVAILNDDIDLATHLPELKRLMEGVCTAPQE